MKYKHLIFDIDGTLVDNEKAVIATWQETITQLFGKYYETSELNFVLGIPGETSMQKLGAENPQEAFKIWSENFKKHKSEIKLFPNIPDLMHILKVEKMNLGLVTSRTHNELDNDYALCKIIDYFDTIICVTDTLRPKPYPDPLLTYLEKCCTPSHEALYIGDSNYDSQCAKEAKVDFGLAMWGKNKWVDADAKFYFEDPLDIIKII
ncbi:HAD family hydrolase [Barnesiella intestinihominis]|uniref:HAD family hydrolase n=1 Tax=Barnesiella intestinihominis TaxID=487174 RepID=UPI003AB35B07